MRPSPTLTRQPDGMPAGLPVDAGRFAGIVRDYSPAEVEKLAGSFRVQHTLADMGARRLWQLLRTEPFFKVIYTQTIRLICW